MSSFLPSPLHPAIVHFPIVLMMLLPLAAFGALWAIRRGTPPVRAWLFPVMTAAALTGSAWAALETGERDEDRVEKIVGEQALTTHENAANRFLALATGVMVLTAIGLVRGNLGRRARMLGSVAALGLIVAGYQVGHSGGQIVYGNGTTSGLVGMGGGAGAGVETGGARESDD